MEQLINDYYEEKEAELIEAENQERIRQRRMEELAERRRKQNKEEMKTGKGEKLMGKKIVSKRPHSKPEKLQDEEENEKMKEYKRKERLKKRQSRSVIWMPTSHPCTTKDRGITLDKVGARSANKKAKQMILKSAKKGYDKEELKEWDDEHKKTINKNMNKQMTYSDVENCLFKPRILLTEEQQKNMAKDIDDFITKMGKNLSKKCPNVYKVCKIGRAHV